MTTEQLSDLAVVAMNTYIVTIDKRLVCDKLSMAHILDGWLRIHSWSTNRFFLKEGNLVLTTGLKT